MMSRAFAFCACLLGMGCSSPAACPVPSYLGEVVSHVGSTIKLNTQSDCAGYSRANAVNGVSNDQAIRRGPAVCAPDPDDGACIACLRKCCCDAVGALCEPDGGFDLDPADCAAEPSVHSCVVGAIAGDCAAACGS